MTILYIISSAIIPLDDGIIDEASTSNYNINNNYFLGTSLIILGSILLVNTFVPIYFPEFLSIIKFYVGKLIDLWPVILIVLGIYLLLDKNRKELEK